MRNWWWIYLGFGLFFTDFFPYFLHLKPSSMISKSDFVLKATLNPKPVFFLFPPSVHSLQKEKEKGKITTPLFSHLPNKMKEIYIYPLSLNICVHMCDRLHVGSSIHQWSCTNGRAFHGGGRRRRHLIGGVVEEKVVGGFKVVGGGVEEEVVRV